MYGIKVNRNITNGKKAIKKENAIAEALVAIDPFTMLCQKKRATSYNGTPSKNGNLIFFAGSAILSPSLIRWFKYLSTFVIMIIVLQFSTDEYNLFRHFFSAENIP